VGPLAVIFAVFVSPALAFPVTGVIGFLGLMVPHITRAIIGIRHEPLILVSAIVGANMMLAGHLASRVLPAPQELPVGIVTAAAGGVFVRAGNVAPDIG
jgi:iron complex transport system permease protein